MGPIPGHAALSSVWSKCPVPADTFPRQVSRRFKGHAAERVSSAQRRMLQSTVLGTVHHATPWVIVGRGWHPRVAVPSLNTRGGSRTRVRSSTRATDPPVPSRPGCPSRTGSRCRLGGPVGEPEVVSRIGPRSSPVGSAGVRLTRAGRVVASSGQTDVDGRCGRLTSRTASMLGSEPRCRSLAPWRACRAQVPMRDLLPPHPLRRPNAARRGDHRKDRGRADEPGRHPTPPVLTRSNLNAVTPSTEAGN